MKKHAAWKFRETCRSRATEEMVADGFSRFKMDGAAELALTRPELVVKETTGRLPTRVEVLHVRPVPGESSYVESGVEAQFHTDSGRMPPHLQYLICKNPARDGGDSRFVDTWAVARAIKREDREFFDTLFDQIRLFLFNTGPAIGYTFGLRRRDLVCIYPPFPSEGDPVGQEFHGWVSRAKTTEFRLEKNELVMASNHRLLHGRSAFKDPKRHLVRILAWFDEPIDQAPAEWIQRAKVARDRLEAATRGESDWVKNWAGVTSPEAEVAALPEGIRDAFVDLVRKLHSSGLTPELMSCQPAYHQQDIDFVLIKMIGATLQALSQIPSQAKKNAAIVDLFRRTQNAKTHLPRRKTSPPKAA